MKFLRKTILPIFLATLWISTSEFVRNQLLLNSIWKGYYSNLGLAFPEQPINGLLWILWSLMFAITIFIVARKFELWQTVFLTWFFGFVMMWIVAGNLGFLPPRILAPAIPLSMLETFLATYIVRKFQQTPG